MAEEDEGVLDKLERETTEKSPVEAIKDDLAGGDSAEGEVNPAKGAPMEESKGQATDTPGGPGVYKEDDSG